jgi:hypothetical protein
MESVELPKTYDEAIARLKEGCEFTNMKVLRLEDDTGWTVAHYMARHGHTFTHPEILNMRSRRGTRVSTLQKQSPRL